MHFKTSTGNSSGPTALPFFFLLLRTFFTSSLLTQFTSLLTTSASSVLGSLLFSSFISFSKYSFHLFNTVSELTITLPFSSFITLTCCTSFPAQSFCLANLYNSFSPSFVSNLAYKLSYACSFAIATAFFALLYFSLYTFLLFSSLILSHAFLRLSFLLCYSKLRHSTTMSPCLLFISQMSLPAQFQLFLLEFALFCPIHQVSHPCFP